jgi:transcription initiation factor TFIIIB Brf1 subunit/transcription initiation factor TFIIB
VHLTVFAGNLAVNINMAEEDRKDVESPSKTLFNQICNALGLDNYLRLSAERLLTDYKEKDETWVTSTQDENKSRSVVRCAILIASKTAIIQNLSGEKERVSPIYLSQLLAGRNSADLHSFILRLKDFQKLVQIDEPGYTEIQNIINNFAFSLTLFNKYLELWDKLGCRLPEDEAKHLKDLGWILYCIARINILQRRTEIVECGCMMVAVLHFVSVVLGSGYHILTGTSEDMLRYLSALLKANPDQVRVASSHLTLLVEKFKEHEVLSGTSFSPKNLEGILTTPHLKYNLSNLSLHYLQRLLPNDIDEREFLFKTTQISTPLRKTFNSYTRQISKLVSHRILSYEDEEQITITSKLGEIKFPSLVSNSPYSIKNFPPSTPMTTAMELSRWLNEHLDNFSNGLPRPLVNKFDTYASEAFSGFENSISSMRCAVSASFEKHGIYSDKSAEVLKQSFGEDVEVMDNKLDSLIKFFYVVMNEVLINEEKQQDIRGGDKRESMRALLMNEVFLRALMVCCTEAILFIYNLNSIDFVEIVEILQVTSFDAWKLFTSFLSFDIKMPTSLRQHFQMLEVRVVTSLAWTDDSPLPAIIKQELNGEERGNIEINHPAIQMFFKKVLAHAALRIMELGQNLNLIDSIKEEIWEAMKQVLSNQTEILINRHMDQIIVCTIYGVCKAKQLHITFNSLIARYTELCSDPGHIFRLVRLDESGNSGDIIKFYNTVFILHMKNFLLAISKTTPNILPKPRLPSLHPPSPIRQNLPPSMLQYSSSPLPNSSLLQSPLKSPFLTPRSKRLYAFGESPSQALEGINRMMQRPNGPIDFDEEEQRYQRLRKIPVHMREILEESQYECNMPEPPLTSFKKEDV